jgi:hypothetical protein
VIRDPSVGEYVPVEDIAFKLQEEGGDISL